MSWIMKYNLFLLLGISYIFDIFWLTEFKNKLRMNTLAVALIPFFGIGIGVLSVKLLALLELGSGGAMRIYGAIFLDPIIAYTAAKLFKRNAADVLDVFTIPIIFALLCGRINCLFSGCCTGSLILESQEIFLPIREFEIILYVILLVKLGSKVGKKPCDGTAYPIFLMSYGFYRFIIEWFRDPGITIGILHISHIWSIIAFVMGACIYIYLSKCNVGKRHKIKKEGKKK